MQVVAVIRADLPLCCAALNPWDDSQLTLAGPACARSYRVDAASGSSKASNLLMLVSSLMRAQAASSGAAACKCASAGSGARML